MFLRQQDNEIKTSLGYTAKLYKPKQKQEQNSSNPNKNKKGWRISLVVKSTGYTCRGHRFSSQHLYGELQPSLTLVPWVPSPSSSLPVYWANTWFTCIHLDKTPYTSLMSGIKDGRHLDWMYLLACFEFWCTAFYKKNCLAELLSLSCSFVQHQYFVLVFL